MKNLQYFIGDKIENLYKEKGAFFAFSNKQFEESKKDGVEYVNLGYGLICPKDNVTSFYKEFEAIYDKGIKDDISENGRDVIILRELLNREAFYSEDIQDTQEALINYGFTYEEILKVYKENYDRYTG